MVYSVKMAATRAWRTFIFALIIASPAYLLLLNWQHLDRVEPWLNPIVSHFTVTHVVQTGDGHIQIAGTYFKYRPCPGVSTSWFMKSSKGLQRVYYKEASPNRPSRPVGLQDTSKEPVTLDADWDERFNRFINVTRHHCNPLIDAETEMFNGPLPTAR
jgi:hypothetical protein